MESLLLLRKTINIIISERVCNERKNNQKRNRCEWCARGAIKSRFLSNITYYSCIDHSIAAFETFVSCILYSFIDICIGSIYHLIIICVCIFFALFALHLLRSPCIFRLPLLTSQFFLQCFKCLFNFINLCHSKKNRLFERTAHAYHWTVLLYLFFFLSLSLSLFLKCYSKSNLTRRLYRIA